MMIIPEWMNEVAAAVNKVAEEFQNLSAEISRTLDTIPGFARAVVKARRREKYQRRYAFIGKRSGKQRR